MICDKCGFEIPDGSKFCPECGSKVEEKKEEIVLTLDTEPVVEEEVEVKEETVEEVVEPAIPVEMPTIQEVKEWYFVEDQKSMGPYSVSEMKSYIEAGRVHPTTFVWKQGMNEWQDLAKTSLASLVQPTVEEEKKEEAPTSNVEWYYINATSQQVGPLSIGEMIDAIEKGNVQQNTYVWATGMADWVFAKDSELRNCFNRVPNNAPVYTAPTNNATYTAGNGVLGVEKRNIAVCIILSIVTCGIYGLYWFYTMANDVNKICAKYGHEQQQTSAGMVILFSLLTCGIYYIYWIYQCGKRLSRLQFSNGYRVSDDSVMMLVLTIFGLGIVSECILQTAINDITTYAK